MRTESGSDDQHRVEAALERDRRILAPTLPDMASRCSISVLKSSARVFASSCFLGALAIAGYDRVKPGL